MESYFLYGFVLLVSVACNHTVTDLSKDQSLVVEKRIKFDTLKVNNSYIKSIKIVNPSNDTVFIEKIIHSCECVQILNKPYCILPHNTDSLEIVFSPEKVGYISRGIFIHIQNKQEPIDIILEGYTVE